ncbi:MAG: EAL domain-containing protein [Thermicanus sp.]|nr:EAL domain-containing protein [Thermicanus sp.]
MKLTRRIDSDQGSFDPVILLKEKGYTIAIDDFGKGETSLSTALYLEPSFVKLDRYFATDLATSVNKIEVIRTLIDIFQKKKIKIVLEGIEKPIDLAMAKALGVDIGQGYLLGMPKPINEIHVTRS